MHIPALDEGILVHLTTSRPRSAGLSERTLALLAGILLIALFVAPSILAGNTFGNGDLTRALGDGFVEYWSAGSNHLPPRLDSAVHYWSRFHVAKAVIAVLLLAVVTPLGIRLWQTYLRAGKGRRLVPLVSGVSITAIALFAGLVLMANIQGALAPFSSLLSLLPMNDAAGDLASTLVDVRRQLAAGDITPVIDMMTTDFGWYHAVMAVIAVVATVVLLGTSALLWRRRVRTDSADRRARTVLGVFCALSVLLMLLTGVTALANAGTAADPGPALVGFFDGGF
ncbi:putative small integral membrane protein [Rhodococcus sp. 27YEA15]|uniref:hypothetical protein n=1 Tax=Rhodococcus sp. 27YEA15 TaxID=3156259 RepID=UPI003C7B004A